MLPACALVRRSAHHLRAELADEPAVLGDGHELRGETRIPVDMAPPREGLGAYDLAVLQRYQGLVVQVDLLIGQRCAESRLGSHAVEDPDVHLAVEQLESPAAGHLRLVHGRVRVAQELRGARTGRPDGDADARADRVLVATKHDRLLQRAVQVAGDRGHGPLGGKLLAQHRELVAAEARRACPRRESRQRAAVTRRSSSSPVS